MSKLLLDINDTRKVQSNIHRFEALTVKQTQPSHKDGKYDSNKLISEVDWDADSNELLKPVTTRSTIISQPANAIVPANNVEQIRTSHRRHDSAIFDKEKYLRDKARPSLAEDAREILKSQPSVQDIESVLTYLQYGMDGQHDFNIKVSNPQTSQLIRIIVTTTIPDVWEAQPTVNSSVSEQATDTLKHALSGVVGLEAVLEQIRTFTRPPSAGQSVERLQIYISLLEQLLSSTQTTHHLLQEGSLLYDKEVQRRLHWQSVVSLLAGSKILNILASLLNVIAELDQALTIPDWLVSGELYSRWLARNIAASAMALSPTDQRLWLDLAHLLKRSLSLGYKDQLISELYDTLLLGKSALWTPLRQLMTNLSIYDQQAVLDCILDDVSHQRLRSIGSLSPDGNSTSSRRSVGAAATLIAGILGHSEALTDHVIEWLSGSSVSTARNAAIRRATIAALATSEASLGKLLERSLITFADRSYMRHTDISQQQLLAQTILMALGYLHRTNANTLKQDPFPLLIMNATSNRLGSSVPGIRLLGMVVGTAISRCVDEPGKHLTFDTEDMDSDQVRTLLDLLQVRDTPDDVQYLGHKNTAAVADHPRQKRPAPRKPHKKPETVSKIVAIEELSASSDDEQDLIPMAKPLHDPEDSDEDPTLINRNKPRRPVYIRDLIKQLNAPNESLDVISLALETAAPLIRRKSGFGTELKDSIHELTSTLINVRDGLSESEHSQQRLDALTACFVAEPRQIGPYLAQVYFEGDFSLSQRSTVLIALGVGSRRIAGLDDAAEKLQLDDFPSQRLPPHLQIPGTTTAEATRSVEPNTVSQLANQAVRDTIRPLAAAAASSQAGPDVLKVSHTTRTSASLSVRAEKEARNKAKSKKIAKDLYNTICHQVFVPLISPLTAILVYAASKGESRTRTPLLHPGNLSLHLQTLTLLLHTLGPTGLGVTSIQTSITNEILLLFMALESVPAIGFDPVVLPAQLGLFLALIDITAEIGVAAQEILLSNEFGSRVAECVRWVCQLEDTPGVPSPMHDAGKMDGGMAWTVLAAGIQVRWHEIGKRFQSRMLGFSLD